ncbi:MAG TPA: YciI family protein [Steroidobacteraceae bacterium]|nr:YciI family protein [Steroidobacteraceae bacterium]
MKFMMMMNMPRGTGDYQINQWTPEAINAHIQFMKDLNRDLRKAGEFVDAQGLTPPGQAKLVRYGGGAPIVSDGPFAESKEFLAGYWIIDVPTRERAYAIAARVSSAPGPDGKPLVIPVELREVMASPLPDEA